MPIGTLEWHENHLPFGLDAFTAYSICLETCKRKGGCVLPPLYYGTDTVYQKDGKEYRGMNIQAEEVLPGSVYPLDKDLFKALITTVINNLEAQGFKKIVIVTGHCEPAQIAVLNEIYSEKHYIDLIIFPREGVFFEGGLDHVGQIETSLMLNIDSSLVHMDKLQKPYKAIIGEDPLNASKEAGEKQMNAIVEQLTRMIV